MIGAFEDDLRLCIFDSIGDTPTPLTITNPAFVGFFKKIVQHWDGRDFFVLISRNNGSDPNSISAYDSMMTGAINSVFTASNFGSLGEVQDAAWIDYSEYVAILGDSGKFVIVPGTNIATQSANFLEVDTGTTFSRTTCIGSIPYSGKIMFYTDSGSTFHIYESDILECGDPLAATCNPEYKAGSLTCKANASDYQPKDMPYKACRCNPDFYFNKATKTCDACHSSCSVCTGPDYADCNLFVIKKSSPGRSGIAYFNSFLSGATDEIEALVWVGHNSGESYKVDFG